MQASLALLLPLALASAPADGGAAASQQAPGTSPERPIEFWRGIVASAYAVPEDESPSGLIRELSQHLGARDPELRDELAYTISATWILRDGRLTGDEMLDLMDLWAANLDYAIGSVGDDTVLLRSFSALCLALLAARDNAEPFLEREGFEDLLQAALSYLEAERDLRGWEAEAGWFHSAAHTADLLKFLGRSQHLLPEEQADLLEGIAGRLIDTEGYAFAHGEDERFAAAAYAVISREDFDPAALDGALKRLTGARPGARQAGGLDPIWFAGRQNAKAFLRVLYLGLALIEQPSTGEAKAAEATLDALKRM
ncbi:MAG: DUF2785 domain-containing protein [Planctomycetota bacterium]